MAADTKRDELVHLKPKKFTAGSDMVRGADSPMVGTVTPCKRNT